MHICKKLQQLIGHFIPLINLEKKLKHNSTICTKKYFFSMFSSHLFCNEKNPIFFTFRDFWKFNFQTCFKLKSVEKIPSCIFLCSTFFPHFKIEKYFKKINTTSSLYIFKYRKNENFFIQSTLTWKGRGEKSYFFSGAF